MDYTTFYDQLLGGRDHPLHASIELTHRCNLFCAHCYIPLTRHRRLRDLPAIRAAVAGELDTARWFELADTLAEVGCLDVLLTGGDPLVRGDFLEIYDKFKRLGMVVTVFTNGTLITDEIASFWAKRRPRTVEVSLYGATPETYEAVTGIAGGYERTLEGIERLARHGVAFVLKSVLLEPNRHEIEDMRTIARRYGAGFRFTSDVFPEYGGCKTPKDIAPSPEDAAAIAVLDPLHLATWSGEVEECRPEAEDPRIELRASDSTRDDGRNRVSSNSPVAGSDLFSCKAGARGFSIDPEGRMQFCLMLRHVRVDLAREGFANAWETMRTLRAMKKSGPTRCDGCEIRTYCQCCPARNYLETGNPELPGDEQCIRAHAMAVALGRTGKTLERFLDERRAKEAQREAHQEGPWQPQEARLQSAQA